MSPAALFDIEPAPARPVSVAAKKAAPRKRPDAKPAPVQSGEIRTGRLFAAAQAIPLLGGTIEPGATLELVSEVIDGRGNFHGPRGLRVCNYEIEGLTEVSR